MSKPLVLDLPGPDIRIVPVKNLAREVVITHCPWTGKPEYNVPAYLVVIESLKK